MVQLACQAFLDAGTGDDRDDLADSLPVDSDQLWLCVCEDVWWQCQLAGGVALCDQFGGESDFHSDSVRDA